MVRKTEGVCSKEVKHLEETDRQRDRTIGTCKRKNKLLKYSWLTMSRRFAGHCAPFSTVTAAPLLNRADGEEALAEVKADRPDLVLLDFNMPGIAGLEVCKRIRQLSDVPIIMVTVRDSEKDKVLALDGGSR